MTFAMISGAILILTGHCLEGDQTSNGQTDFRSEIPGALYTKIDPGKSTICKKSPAEKHSYFGLLEGTAPSLRDSWQAELH